MGAMYVFGDEAGNLDFSRDQGATTYFIIGTVALADLTLTQDLLALRRDLALRGKALETCFHATEDLQEIRDEVFALLQRASFRIDVTILEKCKTKPRLQSDAERFYKTAWYLHFKFIAPSLIAGRKDLLVVAASRGTRKMRSQIRSGIADVVEQSVSPNCTWEVAFWGAESDPGLQIADYCTWAVQRKLEGGDDRSYVLIADKIRTEFQPFAIGRTRYY
jgi:Protein of unknown function (DUF3800)